jgi:hypothetical protein
VAEKIAALRALGGQQAQATAAQPEA